MHLGRIYPFAFEFWQVETQWWPGYVPKKLYVDCGLGAGTFWDKLNGGIVTAVMEPDWFGTGNVRWVATGFSPGYNFQFSIVKTADGPPKNYGANASISGPGPLVVNAISATNGDSTDFGPFTFGTSSILPPYSLGTIPPLTIRPATWSEV